MIADEEDIKDMKGEKGRVNIQDDYPFQLYNKARRPSVSFHGITSPSKHMYSPETQPRGGMQQQDKYYGLTLQKLKEIARTTGVLGDEETIGQEAALNRLRDFMRFMGKYATVRLYSMYIYLCILVLIFRKENFQLIHMRHVLYLYECKRYRLINLISVVAASKRRLVISVNREY